MLLLSLFPLIHLVPNPQTPLKKKKEEEGLGLRLAARAPGRGSVSPGSLGCRRTPATSAVGGARTALRAAGTALQSAPPMRPWTQMHNEHLLPRSVNPDAQRASPPRSVNPCKGPLLQEMKQKPPVLGANRLHVFLSPSDVQSPASLLEVSQGGVKIRKWFPSTKEGVCVQGAPAWAHPSGARL